MARAQTHLVAEVGGLGLDDLAGERRHMTESFDRKEHCFGGRRQGGLRSANGARLNCTETPTMIEGARRSM